MKYDLNSINHEQKLYVLNCGNGYTCLGFDVCDLRTKRLSSELGVTYEANEKGTEEHYYTYCILTDEVRKRNALTGFRSSSELNPKLIGLEGKRIECEMYGTKVRFNVGKSTGYIPCHLEIKTSRSHGGMAISSNPDDLQNIRIIS